MAELHPSLGGASAWDEQRAQSLLGKHVLVGITYLEADGQTVAAQVQLHGTVVSVDQKNGIEISRRGLNEGEPFWLPPATGPFEDASPGEYNLHSTGEILVNPDIISTWTVTRSKTK